MVFVQFDTERAAMYVAHLLHHCDAALARLFAVAVAALARSLLIVAHVVIPFQWLVWLCCAACV